MNPVFDKFDLTGKTALITGGATGLGYEMAKALAQSGAKVMIAARRVDVLKAAAEKLLAEPHVSSVLYHPLDLIERESVKALGEHVAATWGGADIFIGNAGLEAPQGIESITDDALDEQVRVHMTGNIELTRDLMPYMRRKKWGRFIYSSSVAGQLSLANNGVSVYGSAKAGLNMFTKYVAAEGGRDGITANVLSIGNFLTDMAREHIESLDEAGQKAYKDGLLSMICLGRSALPHEIAGLVQLLASDAGSYITGACIPIDGGISSLLLPNPVA